MYDLWRHRLSWYRGWLLYRWKRRIYVSEKVWTTREELFVDLALGLNLLWRSPVYFWNSLGVGWGGGEGRLLYLLILLGNPHNSQVVFVSKFIVCQFLFRLFVLFLIVLFLCFSLYSLFFLFFSHDSSLSAYASLINQICIIRCSFVYTVTHCFSESLIVNRYFSYHLSSYM